MSKEERVVLLVMFTLPISYFWKLHPHAALPDDQVPWLHLFPYSETVITWPTYISMVCANINKLIWVYAACEMFPKFKWSLNTWFVIQALQFVEFFFTYNETQFFTYLFGHKVELGLHLAKLILPWMVFIWEMTWKDRL